jgi:hypothetical protein
MVSEIIETLDAKGSGFYAEFYPKSRFDQWQDDAPAGFHFLFGQENEFSLQANVYEFAEQSEGPG